MSGKKSPSRIETFMFAYNYMQPPRRLDDIRRAAEAAARKAEQREEAGLESPQHDDKAPSSAQRRGDAGDAASELS